ncbi:MAG: prolipoprotein diacylglyceryl transferase [Spirochaetales bacterium]|nr:prolipoprotein diacylglyceryl transferase [Spirochaetales bacterium]
MYLYIDYPSFISPYVIPGLPIRWYSIMYIVAFAFAYLIVRVERKRNLISISDDDVMDLFMLAIGFLLLGARLGSVFIYDDNRLMYLTHPWLIFWPFEDGRFVGLPGMSYHGGIVGVVVGVLLFCRNSRRKAQKQYLSDVKLLGRKRADKKQRSTGFSFYQMTDMLLLGVPLGYTFGRLGNFINAELYGRVTDSALGMMFPNAERLSTSLPWVADMATELGIPFSLGDYVNLPRFPSQLYEALFEGIVVFLILWFVVRPYVVRKKCFGNGMITGSYLVLYGVFRFFLEYLREPDANIGYVFSFRGKEGPIQLFESMLNISMGQVLCALMIIWGLLIIICSRKRCDRHSSEIGDDNDRK